MTYPDVRGTLSEQRALADLTWLRVGGPADALFQPAIWRIYKAFWPLSIPLWRCFRWAWGPT